MTIYWMGGAPCSGKSTIADLLVDRCGVTLYRCDDHFFRHVEEASTALPVLHSFQHMAPDDTWLIPVRAQVEREITAYCEEFTAIQAEIAALPRPLLVEGASLLPDLVAPLLTDPDEAIWLVPTAAFQREHYARRDWAQDVVASTSDPARAFEFWMQRDVIFARWVRARAVALGLQVIVVDGAQSIAHNAALVTRHFGLTP